VKRAALYVRVSTVDQNLATQLLDLRQMAAQRGYEVVKEYTDRISGVKTRRPGLDDLMRDARRGMRRAKLEGRHIGRKPLELDRDAIRRDRQHGQSLGQIAKAHRISRATVHRVIHEQNPSEKVA
jgi:DNA invertase Pin-like site-specific DNA recombinase